MLEQAVYAGRNHKAILAAVLIALAIFAPPTQAAEIVT
jgi:hypothetical protein